MFRSSLRFPKLETILWILASIAAFVSLLVVVPSFLGSSPGSSTARADRQSTARPTLTPLAVATLSPTRLAVSVSTPVQKSKPFPTPQPNTQAFEFASDLKRTGWFASGESTPHLGDRNLHAGSFKGQTFQSILAFEMPVLPPGSKIYYAQIELTGFNRNNLGTDGSWTLQLLPNSVANPDTDFRTVTAQGKIGSSVTPDNMGEGIVNQFVFAPDQLPFLEDALAGTGNIFFRLTGPSSGEDLFTWDGGDRDPAIGVRPTLRLIATAAPFLVITNTPTPGNVLTAAAVLVRNTEAARRGTATPLPRAFATATPQVVITSAPSPANVDTATAVAAYATAVAFTTGTFTPTPLNWITATPIPLIIPLLTSTPTPIPTATLTRYEITHKPFPPGLLGKILFLAGPREAPLVYIMDANGKNVGQFTDRDLYDIAAYRDTFSPSGLIEAFNAPDPNNSDLLQIFFFDYSIPGGPRQPNYNQVTYLRRGIAYAPSWAPDSNKIAYTSTETGLTEIYSLDVTTKRPTQLTTTKGWNYNQFPSWSPDGKQIVYASDRARPGTFADIWVMNADGNNQARLLDLGRDAWSPVWIKWSK